MKLRLWAAAGLFLLFSPTQLSAVQVNTNGKLQIVADDYSFSMRIIGRVYADTNIYRSDSPERELVSGAFIRMARIGISGNFHEWEYDVEFDNATNEAKLKDAKLRRPVGPGKLSIGQFKVMESLEKISSENDLAFMERPYVGEIVPGFKIGIAYDGTAGMVGYSGNVYNLREASDGESQPLTDGTGVVGRIYVAPIHSKTVALHFGGSYAYETTDSSGSRVRVSPLGRAEEYVSGEEFRFELYDRREERAEINRIILESAFIDGPLSAQAEYLKGSAQTKTRPDDDFTAWYGQIAYVLTGEFREYEMRRAVIKRPNPTRKSGAWEIAGRYQRAKRDNEPNAELIATELGVTWYSNANVRFMVNYGWADNKLINDKPRMLGTRVQFDF